MKYRVDIGRAFRRNGEIYGGTPTQEMRSEDYANIEDYCQAVARKVYSYIQADKINTEGKDETNKFTGLSVARRG